jgi:sugar-specific transcriptional regulator TrmB
MNLEEILIKGGLDEKEAKVYLALLDLGNEKVHAIAKKAEIKRPTAYVVLEQLYAKNFVIKTYHNKKAFYSAEKPDILLRALKEKQNLLEEALPLLQARMSSSKIKPKIRIYEGRRGIEQVYDEMMGVAVVNLFGSRRYLSEETFGNLESKLKNIIKSKDIYVRDLQTDDPKDLDFSFAAQGKNYEARIVPKELGLYIDGGIYDDNVAIISIKKELFAVVIESKEVADTFRSLFELAWKMSIPLEQFIKNNSTKP